MTKNTKRNTSFKFKFDFNWKSKKLTRQRCKTNKSVKYKLDNGDTVCNLCVLK